MCRWLLLREEGPQEGRPCPGDGPAPTSTVLIGLTVIDNEWGREVGTVGSNMRLDRVGGEWR